MNCSKHPDTELDDIECRHCNEGDIEPENEFDFHSRTCWHCRGTGVLKAWACWKCDEEQLEELMKQEEEFEKDCADGSSL